MIELKSEKSLLEIWSKALPLLPPNRFNFWFTRSGIALGLIPLVFGPIPKFWSIASPLSELMVQVIGTLLGFIIAGYTIFASASNPDFLVSMAGFVPKQSHFPLLKMHLLNFLRLFLYSFLAMVILLSIVFIGRFWPVVSTYLHAERNIRILGQLVVLSLLGFASTLVLAQIKSLIYNLYDLTITQVRYLQANPKRKDSTDVQ